jgi:predicted HicB family RNase H-like nuclease
MMTEQKKMGRPKAENPRSKKVEVRMTTDEHERLSAYCNEHGVTISELIRQFIDSIVKK